MPGEPLPPFDPNSPGASASPDQDSDEDVASPDEPPTSIRLPAVPRDKSREKSREKSRDKGSPVKVDKLKLPKVPKVRPPGAMGTNVHSTVAGISVSNAMATLSPPPPNPQPGTEWAPWLELTQYEQHILRKRMKKNANWQPSEIMKTRELAEKGRGGKNYQAAKKAAEEKGETLLDEKPHISVRRAMATEGLSDQVIDPALLNPEPVTPADLPMTPVEEPEAPAEHPEPAPVETPAEEIVEKDEKVAKNKKEDPSKRREIEEQVAREQIEMERSMKIINDAGRAFQDAHLSSPGFSSPFMPLAKNAKTPAKRPARKRKAPTLSAQTSADVEHQAPKSPEKVSPTLPLPEPKKTKLAAPEPATEESKQKSASPDKAATVTTKVPLAPAAPGTPDAASPPRQAPVRATTPVPASPMEPVDCSPTAQRATRVSKSTTPQPAPPLPPSQTIEPARPASSSPTEQVPETVEPAGEEVSPTDDRLQRTPTPAPIKTPTPAPKEPTPKVEESVITQSAQRPSSRTSADTNLVNGGGSDQDAQGTFPLRELRGGRTSLRLSNAGVFSMNDDSAVSPTWTKPSATPVTAASTRQKRGSDNSAAENAMPISNAPNKRKRGSESQTEVPKSAPPARRQKRGSFGEEVSKTPSKTRPRRSTGLSATSANTATTPGTRQSARQVQLATRPAPSRATGKATPRGRPKQKKQQQQQQQQQKMKKRLQDEEGESSEEEADGVYCICQGPDDGRRMVACDGECEMEWFHLECVGLKSPPGPRAKWFCPDCRARLGVSENGRETR